MLRTQLSALMKKEFIVSKRSPKGTCCELLLPVVIGVCVGLFILLVALIQDIIGGATSDLNPTSPIAWGGWVGSTPNTPENVLGSAVVTGIKLASRLFNFSNVNASMYFSVEDLLQGYDAERANTTATWYSFLGLESNGAPLNRNGIPLNYTLYASNREFGNAAAMAMGLIDLFFQPANSSEFGAFMPSHSPLRVAKHLTQRGIYILMNFRAIMAASGAAFLIYAFIPALLVTTARLVSEKRNRVRESLKVMGVTNAAYVVSNVLAAWIRMGFGTILIAFVLAATKAISPGQIPVVAGIGALFAASIIGFAQLVVSIFSTPSLAYVLCIIFLWGSATLSGPSTGLVYSIQIMFCLLSPVSFFYAVLPEISGGSVVLQVDQSTALIMMAVDSVLYLLMGQYISAVAPGEFGVPKHPLFFLGFQYQRQHMAGLASPRAKKTKDDSGTLRVVIDNLVKYYGNNVDSPAVNGLTMGIHEREIFALLGHNGAGKTTTISMLTGLVKASDYVQCTVDGLDITRDIAKIRQNIGLCPQFDVLYDDLTAREHLQLFAKIKGHNADEERINYLLRELELLDESKVASKFSGGMKRRLSVGNALVGGASLVFLDEPSSGMDPLNRRRMWNLLKAERDMGKTLVLTTHFMEEADYLGDRIAIMSHGKLYCCNTAQQLKDTYGVGFYISLVKPPEDPTAADVDGALKLIDHEIGSDFTATLHQNTSGDATFMLPTQALPQFGKMLTALEQSLSRLKFVSYGVSMTTLEDVFISVSKKEEETHKAEFQRSREKSGVREETAEEKAHTLAFVDGRPVAEWFEDGMSVPHGKRIWSQIKMVFSTKFALLRRNRRMQVLVLGVPLAFMTLAFLALQPQPQAVSTEFNGAQSIPYDDLTLIYIALDDVRYDVQIRMAFEEAYLRAHPNSALSWRLCKTWDEYSSGAFVPVRSLNFIGGVEQPPYPAGFMFHALDLSPTSLRPFANYTILYNGKFTFAAAGEFASLMATAIEQVAGNSDVDVQMFITPKDFPSTNSSDGTGTSILSTTTPTGGEIKYQFMNVGVNLVISLVMLLTNCALPVADDIKRGVYNVLRCHGMTSMGYFIGNMLFDLTVLLYPFFIFTIAVYAKGVGAYDSAVILIVLLAGILYAIHVLLHCYILAGSQRFGPIGIVVASQGGNLATLAMPYLLHLGLKNLSENAASNLKPFLLSMFPSTCFYHILDNASDLTHSTTTASYLLTFTGIGTAWGLVFLVVELLVPLYFVHRLITDHHQHRPLRKDKSAKPATVVRTETENSTRREGSTREKESATTPLLLASRTPNVDRPKVNGSETSLEEIDETHRPDPDVQREAERILHGAPHDNMIAVKHLLKCYGYIGNVKVAVDETTFGIKKGECFGLLGPNGAGKTTTCKCILKQEEPDGGEISFNYAGVGASAPRDEQFLRYRLGVCAQTDTLWEHLNAQEHMEYYLAMRLTTQYDAKKWAAYVRDTLEKVQLSDAGKKAAGGFSGGMKRKLAVCLAMYTGALAVLLDEPSTGMDPFARRALWGVILEALSHDRAVLLTTHSMEEADAVCARIAIMTGGVMRCIGSSQHLKNRFGSGYVVSLTVDLHADTKALDEKVVEFFGKGTDLIEAIGSQRRYSVGALPSLASAFVSIEERAKDWGVLHYSIAQTSSLEQIFLNFVGPDHGRE